MWFLGTYTRFAGSTCLLPRHTKADTFECGTHWVLSTHLSTDSTRLVPRRTKSDVTYRALKSSSVQVVNQGIRDPCQIGPERPFGAIKNGTAL